MVTFSKADVIAYEARTRKSQPKTVAEPVGIEGKLHAEIIKYCDAQWPKWKYIHARMDVPSTIQEGAQDFTIFMPRGRVLCIECKARNEKPNDEQRAWAKQMEMLGHTVHCIRSWAEFQALLPKGEQ